MVQGQAASWVYEHLRRGIGQQVHSTCEATAGMKEQASETQSGRYVYCVTDRAYPKNLRVAGIEGRPVYGIECKGISAVVHRCSLEPYESKDAGQIRKWVVAHHRVARKCWMELGSAVPAAFDTIIKGGDQEVQKWLKDDYDRLTEKLRRLHGKAEYGVQISWNPEIIGRRLIEKESRIKELQLRQRRSRQGMAYILAKKIEQELAGELRKKGEQYLHDFYSKIAGTVDAMHMDPVKKVQTGQMLMNLSVLVTNGKQHLLGKILAEVKGMEGFRVRFTGPWPPYSFA